MCKINQNTKVPFQKNPKITQNILTEPSVLEKVMNNDPYRLESKYDQQSRHPEKYQVKFAHNNQLKDSAIQALARMLNHYAKPK